MAVTVYFKNGGRSVQNGATIVHHEVFQMEENPRGEMVNTTTAGIALKDNEQRVLGRFLQSEIIGYALHEDMI